MPNEEFHLISFFHHDDIQTVVSAS